MSKFEYHYRNDDEKTQQRVMEIRQKYMEPTPQQIMTERLVKLNGKVHRTSTAVAIALGVFGTLVFGVGLTMILQCGLFVWGTVVGIVGCIPTLVARPVYERLLLRLKNKHKEEILQLSEKLIAESTKE